MKNAIINTSFTTNYIRDAVVLEEEKTNSVNLFGMNL